MNDRYRIEVAARAIMLKRVQYGWTFGKQKRVMAIDLEMARAAFEALSAVPPNPTPID